VISYSPGANFSGTDSFRYTVHDVVGFASNPGLVTITVTEVADYRNPDFREDVNRSGAVTPLDVLIGINYYNAHGSQLPADPIPPDQPLYYYDVDGNNRVEPVDLLIVINYLNRAAATGGGEGEAGGDGGAESGAKADDSSAARYVAPSADSQKSALAELAVVEPRGVKRTPRTSWELDVGEPIQFWGYDLLSLLAADVANAGQSAR